MSSAALTSPRVLPLPVRAARVVPLALAGLIIGVLTAALVVALVATTVFDYRILTVRSDSMSPAIETGDIIVVRPRAIEAVSAGDIVLFESGGDRVPTVHRVAGINEVELRVTDKQSATTTVFTDPRLVTKGDANELPDLGEVTSDQFLGEVWFTVPWGTRFSGLPLQYLFLGMVVITCAVWIEWERRHRSGSTAR